MHLLKKITGYISSHYVLDLRALALMRVAIALLVLTDLIIRGNDLAAHYTGQGLWPADLLFNFGWKPGFWSLHAWRDTYSWELFLFCIQGVFAIFLLLGFKTRLSTFIVWLLYISLHNRNLFILQSGDDLLRLTLLWGIFLPWQAYYSIDARGTPVVQLNAMAHVGYLLMIASVYFFTANLKNSGEWHKEGSAIYYALSLDQLRLPGFGDWLYQYPGVMKRLTWFVFYSEYLVPLMILWPSKKGTLRGVAFVLLVILHLGIGLSLYVGLFFIINCVTALGLIPGSVMNKAESVFSIKNKAVLFKSGRADKRFLKEGVCAVLLTLCLIINLGNVHWFLYQPNNATQCVINALRLNQYWGMFSPSVMKTDGWLVYHGADSLGRQWDLRLNQDYVDYHKPAHIVNMYKSDRWRKLAENMQRGDHTFLRPLYCNYILHTWNAHHKKKLAVLNLYYMQKESLPDYKTTPVEKKLFCVCTHD